MHKNELNFPVPDVLGLYDDEAREMIKNHGYTIKTEKITKTAKRGQPEGRLRVVRQRVSGQDLHLVFAYEKWVCDSRKEV
ncbi:MAG: hypothetical protein ACOYI2_08920 [Bacillota bacterium]|jgi:hypothetical protein|nr:hypothetical protein [Clostridia bacterium]